jgi:DNA-binding NarL/FixJ family response regulator
MAHSSCLAGIALAKVPLLSTALLAAGVGTPTCSGLDVTFLGRLEPYLLVCDIDDGAVDGLELLRRLRFVLPECIIAVYTSDLHRSWGVECHLAGANCVLSKTSGVADLASGMRSAIRSGCFTDPLFCA